MSGQSIYSEASFYCMEKPLSRETDEAIIDCIRKGNVDAFKYIVDRYKRKVFQIVSGAVPGEEVEDVAQDVFIRAFLSLSSYRGSSKLEAWISRIAVRACCDFWRRRYRERERVQSALSEEELEFVDEAIAERFDREMHTLQSSMSAKKILERALSRLSAEDRMVVELVHVEERPIKEVARLMGLSYINVKVRASRARKKMRKYLEEIL